MTPTKQTVLHDPANGLHGNCLSAVLASLLHLPIDEVPLFISPDTWVKDLNSWLRQFGLAYCMVEDFECHIDAYGIEGLWHEVSGNTTRSKDVTHACVAKDGEFVFDPHPDDTGLTKITCHGFFIALEPWRALTHNAEFSGRPKAVAWNDVLGLCIRSEKNHADTQDLRALPQGLHRTASQGRENALLQHGLSQCQRPHC